MFAGSTMISLLFNENFKAFIDKTNLLKKRADSFCFSRTSHGLDESMLGPNSVACNSSQADSNPSETVEKDPIAASTSTSSTSVPELTSDIHLPSIHMHLGKDISKKQNRQSTMYENTFSISDHTAPITEDDLFALFSRSNSPAGRPEPSKRLKTDQTDQR